MLPTGRNPAVCELEDDAAVNIQLLAVSDPAVVVNADHASLIICEYVPQFGFERAFRLGIIYNATPCQAQCDRGPI